MAYGNYVLFFAFLMIVVIAYLNRKLKYERYNKAYYNIVKDINKRYHNWNPKKKKEDKLKERMKLIEEYDKKEGWEEAEIKDKDRKIKVAKSVLERRRKLRESKKRKKAKN